MSPTSRSAPGAIAGQVREALDGLGLVALETRPGVFHVDLPGEKKLTTPCRLSVGDHALSLHAFVCRNPDENHLVVYRWLLARNMKLGAVAFSIDSAGDIYLVGKIAADQVTPDAVDALLGEVLSTADGSFNAILELGFATSIRREWQWRVSRDESTANLEAFRGWLESDQDSAG